MTLNSPQSRRTQRLFSDYSSGDQPPANPVSQTNSDILAQVNLHVIDQAISDIASEYRFTVQEVKEFYDKCGEMERTRARFQKMRLILSTISEDIGDEAV